MEEFMSTAQAVLGLAQRSCSPAAFSTTPLVPLHRYSNNFEEVYYWTYVSLIPLLSDRDYETLVKSMLPALSAELFQFF